MPRYSETVMDHFQSPRNWGRLENAEYVGVAGQPGEGRYLVLQLRLDEGRVVAARFQCHGCGATIAAGSVLTEMIINRPRHECLAISADELMAALDGLPPDKRHCAGFAVGALRNALSDADSPEGSRSP